jgi:hypothetical protein
MQERGIPKHSRAMRSCGFIKWKGKLCVARRMTAFFALEQVVD